MSAIKWSRPARAGVRGLKTSVAELGGGVRVEVRRYGANWSVMVPRWGIEADLPGLDSATSWPTARRHALAEVVVSLELRLAAAKGARP
jgi:hypothetical protein